MSEDYLWDKTGSDPEIERFESELRRFAYSRRPVPELPGTGPATVRGFFSLRLAFAMTVLTVLSLGAAWITYLGTRNTPADEMAAADVAASEVLPTAAQTTVFETPEISVPAPIRRSDHKAVGRSTPARNQRRPARPRVEPKPAESEFTSEEMYAYNQLMLALSITTSKLKIVTDAVNGRGPEAAEVPESR